MNSILLESNWQKLFLSFPEKASLVKEIFSQLLTAYSSKERYYHNLSHIQHVLKTINTLEASSKNLSAIQIAAWFHDVIYDSQSHDNEERSAKFAGNYLISIGIPPTTINPVVSLILNTKKHEAPLGDIDSQILLDADLSILGSAESEYMDYAQLIRQEYSWISDEEYRIGRKKVLQSFLERDKIYFTETAFQMFELTARENLIPFLCNNVLNTFCTTTIPSKNFRENNYEILSASS